MDNFEGAVDVSTPTHVAKKPKIKIEFPFQDISPLAKKVAGDIEASAGVEMLNSQNCVFDWVDDTTMLKKVTVILTLPSGIHESDCDLDLGDDDLSGTTQEITVKFPWVERFMDKFVLFKSRQQANDIYTRLPEAIAYEQHLRAYRPDKTSTPYSYFKVRLPFPVQTAVGTYDYSTRGFTADKEVEKDKIRKQYVLIVRLTGVADRYVKTSMKAPKAYESD